MAAVSSLSELENRIAILRANLRELIEQAAAVSGEANEARTSDRIAQQTAELEQLLKEQEELRNRLKDDS